MGRLQFTTNMDAALYSLQYAFIAITSLNLYTDPKVGKARVTIPSLYVEMENNWP